MQSLISFPDDSVQEKVETTSTEKRGTKRSQATSLPSLKSDSPRKKVAKVEPAVKMPDYAKMQDLDDESARVRSYKID